MKSDQSDPNFLFYIINYNGKKYIINWIQNPNYKCMPHQSHGLTMDKQSKQGNKPGKKKSNGQIPQTQQTEKRAQHGS